MTLIDFFIIRRTSTAFLMFFEEETTLQNGEENESDYDFMHLYLNVENKLIVFPEKRLSSKTNEVLK